MQPAGAHQVSTFFPMHRGRLQAAGQDVGREGFQTTDKVRTTVHVATPCVLHMQIGRNGRVLLEPLINPHQTKPTKKRSNERVTS